MQRRRSLISTPQTGTRLESPTSATRKSNEERLGVELRGYLGLEPKQSTLILAAFLKNSFMKTGKILNSDRPQEREGKRGTAVEGKASGCRDRRLGDPFTQMAESGPDLGPKVIKIRTDRGKRRTGCSQDIGRRFCEASTTFEQIDKGRGAQ